MKADRNELVKWAFNKLRHDCASRGVTWADVDLRWGIPTERAAEHGALPICLAEIEKCRPFFIGLLGDRYGYVPEQIPAAVLDAHPWIREHDGASITELEIWCGVLNDPARAPYAAFYFRKQTSLDALDQSVRPDFEESGEERRTRLATLKDRIRASGARWREYGGDPRELADLVLADLGETIDRLYPRGSALDPLDREAADHDMFAASRRSVYIGRDEYIARLHDYIAEGGAPLAVVGDSGAGKSALLANWAAAHREANPRDVTIVHFVGASPHSADWEAMLARITGELKRRLDLELEVPTDPRRLREAFPEFLHRAAAVARVVLVIDALNQLDDRDGAPDLTWLPDELPEAVRLVVSTLPGRALNEIRRRQFSTLSVRPLESSERERLIADYLAIYAKALDAESARTIAAAEQTSNPLFLRTLLGELRVEGEHGSLSSRIRHYLEAATINDLYERVLARYESDYARDRPNLVQDAMTLLWAARRGLAEKELLDMLGSGGEPLPGAYWSPLYLAAEEGLVSRSGLLTFSHNYLRKAIEDRYLPDHDRQKAAHARVAAYFDEQPLSVRRLDELPWQLTKTESWPRLYELLSDTDFLPAAFDADEFELQTYWSTVERHSDYRMADAYGSRLEGKSLSFAFLHAAGILLYSSGNLDAALHIEQTVVRELTARGERRPLAMALNRLANIRQVRGDYDTALGLYRDAEAICRETGDRLQLSALLSNQGRILRTRGSVGPAMRLFEEQEQICREIHSDRGLASALRNRAQVLREQGEDEEALELYREHERICRRAGDRGELATSLTNQASLLASADPDAAMTLYDQSEQIARSLGDQRKLVSALQGRAGTWRFKGSVDRAEQLLREAERISRHVGDIEHLIDTVESLIDILLSTDRVDAAMTLLEETSDLCKARGNGDAHQRCLGTIAGMLQARGDMAGATRCYEEQEQICRELKNWRGLQAALGRHGNLLAAARDLDAAMAMFLERERICRREDIRDGLERAVAARAEILRERGEIDAAMTMYREQHRLCLELDKHEELTHAVLRQADIIANRGHFEGVLQLFKAHEARCRAKNDRAGLAACLDGRGVALAKLGELADARTVLEEAAQVVDASKNPELDRHIREILALLQPS